MMCLFALLKSNDKIVTKLIPFGKGGTQFPSSGLFAMENTPIVNEKCS